jgi:hypothetical protein
VAALLLSGGGAAFAVASLGPDVADLPVRTITRLCLPSWKTSLADLADLNSFTLYRSDYTRGTTRPKRCCNAWALPIPRPPPSCVQTAMCARTCWAALAAWCLPKPPTTTSCKS